MILIVLSWLYLYFTATAFGIAFSKVLKIRQVDIVITPILGLFAVTCLATFWIFFGPIAQAFHFVLFLFSVLFWYKNKRLFTSILQNALAQVKFSSIPIKILFAFSSFLIIAQSATLPFIIDNESYYIQTIKWLTEYGLVKGLANLHLFLGQTSGWHITQSVYSYSFLYDRFNDLNGFVLLLVNFFAFQKLQAFFTKGNAIDLLFGLLPLTYVFLFQFISSPSPDLPVYVFGFLLFSFYLQNDNKKDSFISISILALFAFFIKITAVVLLLIPLVVLVKHFAFLKKAFLKVVLLGSMVLLLFVLKNTILTGYPLFPLLCFRIDSLDYAVPRIIMNFFFSNSMLHSFYIDNSAFESTSILNRVKHYFFTNGMCGYIGLVTVLALIATPIILYKKRELKPIWTLYFTFIVLIGLLCFSSPQYRFYIYFTLFFLLLFISLWLTNHKLILRLLGISLFLVSVFLFVPISYSQLTSNKLLGTNSTFHLKNILVPEPISKWPPKYKGGSVGNMHYNAPVDASFFWVTGNGPLPCLNTLQLDYFHKGFFYIPQQRSTALKDGFYAQKVSGNE